MNAKQVLCHRTISPALNYKKFKLPQKKYNSILVKNERVHTTAEGEDLP
jgi:hypothetical protein